ncbi:TIGR00730 family Rossman fold protein [Parasphingorhabdus sp.]|uniref:LOG family protein n=1 Tax=Parasphingorhabdus sp. TaxID=2709688 RepID=UPI00326706F5
MHKLAVYCGANAGQDPAYAEATILLGKTMAERNVDLVYGGGRLGLMGIIADTVLEHGGQVHGVIPEMLKDLEVAHRGVTELHIVANMHERKAKMTDLTDAFVALPGGVGTMDELFEAWSWNALGYHNKPFAILNIAGYWDAMIVFLDKMTEQGFVSADRRKQLIISDNIADCLDRLAAACTTEAGSFTW